MLLGTLPVLTEKGKATLKKGPLSEFMSSLIIEILTGIIIVKECVSNYYTNPDSNRHAYSCSLN